MLFVSDHFMCSMGKPLEYFFIKEATEIVSVRARTEIVFVIAFAEVR